MSKTLASLRTSTDKQDLNNQKLEILEYAHKRDLKIDAFVEITISSRKTSEQRCIDEVLATLADADTFVVTELSRLGRSTADVIALINALVARAIRAIILEQNLDFNAHDMNSKIAITFFSLFAELERDLISLRPKKHSRAKSGKGYKGKPKGVIQKSKFDKHQERIVELLRLGLSVRKIANMLGYSSHLALNTYINKRKLRDLYAFSRHSCKDCFPRSTFYGTWETIERNIASP